MSNALMDRTAKAIYEFINNACEYKVNNRCFFGSLPSSISHSELGLIRGNTLSSYNEYASSYKADGKRFVMGFLVVDGQNKAFIVNRNFTISYIPIIVPDIYYLGTLLDVESISGLYLVFDCMYMTGKQCSKEFYPIRLDIARCMLKQFVRTDVWKIDEEIAKQDGTYDTVFLDWIISQNNTDIRLKVKQIFRCGYIPKEKWIYPVDGIVWTSVVRTYKELSTTKLSVLKWKPREQITFDFIVGGISRNVQKQLPATVSKYRFNTTQSKNTYPLLISEGSKSTFVFSSVDVGDVTIEEGKVYECYWKDKWVLGIQRKEKIFSNSLDTILKTLDNIENTITYSDIVSLVKN
jgi:hypothetical protein